LCGTDEEVLKLVLQAGELHLFSDMLMSYWTDCTYKIEDYYYSLFHKTVNEANDVSKKIMINAAQRLPAITIYGHEKHDEFGSKLRDVKTRLWDIRSLKKNFIHQSLVLRVMLGRT
jgi:hypothetical protein